MTQKKVLYTASTFGHLAAFHQPYLQWFAEQGYEVHAAAGGTPLPLAGVKRAVSLPFQKSMASAQNWQAMRQMTDLMRRERYALISTHTALAAFFTRFAAMRAKSGAVVMNTCHGYLFDSNTPFLKRTMLLGAEKLTANATAYLLTMNAEDTEIAEKHRLGSQRFFTPGMGVDFSRFKPPDEQQKCTARARFGIRPEEKVLVYAAEFSSRKNQAMLLFAMSALPTNIHLLLAGKGELLEQCRQLVNALGIAARVSFLGFVEDIAACYHAADICVSASRIEGLPFNLMEAMACGLPVIASDIKGHRDLIDAGKNGLLFAYNDRTAFCMAVYQLLDAGNRHAMGAKACESVQPYALERVFPILTEIYAKALYS